MAITLWRNRIPFEELTKWFDMGFFTELPERMLRPAIDVEEKGLR